MTLEISIYIANLGKYNEGELVGKWVDLPLEEEELEDVYVEIGLGYRDEDGDYHHGLWVNGVCYEEMAIHDFNTNVPNLNIGEYDSISKLNELAERLDEVSSPDHEDLELLLKTGELDIEEAISSVLQESGAREYRIWHDCDDMGDIAHSYYEGTGMMESIPEHLQGYIDWEAVGRDMEIEGSYYCVGNNTYVQLID